jgi:hypothetical protein
VPATDLHVVMVDQQDPRLGRQCVQDPRSLAFPWDGSWPPTDTGSSGQAACKAAVQLKLGGEYRWNFTHDASGVVQQIMEGRTVGVGTWWYGGMFNRKPLKGRAGEFYIEPSGARVGGHQYRARGYDADRDMILVRCWWGTFRDVWIKRAHLAELLADDGDAVVQDMTP